MPVTWCINLSPIVYNEQQSYNTWAKYYNITNCTVADNVSLLTLQWNFSVLAKNIQTDGIPTIYCACECTDRAISMCSEDHHSYYFIMTPDEGTCMYMHV